MSRGRSSRRPPAGSSLFGAEVRLGSGEPQRQPRLRPQTDPGGVRAEVTAGPSRGEPGVCPGAFAPGAPGPSDFPRRGLRAYSCRRVGASTGGRGPVSRRRQWAGPRVPAGLLVSPGLGGGGPRTSGPRHPAAGCPGRVNRVARLRAPPPAPTSAAARLPQFPVSVVTEGVSELLNPVQQVQG